MKKSLLTISLSVIFTISSFAQQATGKISGTVGDQSGSPAEFVTVALLDSDSVLVKAGYSEPGGAFVFESISPGEYQLQLSSVQFDNYTSGLFKLSANEHYQHPPITITTTVTKLEGVQVTATKPLVEVQPDKTVFNVENSVNAAGNDGMELLRKAPGVIVDNNDNIILQGKNGVRIYIDGKPSQLRGEDLVAMLRSMQSDNIESIEIITNPNAKYDAEGNAGIINIKIKRDKNLGTNGSMSAGYSVGQKTRYNAGVNFNNREKKSNVFGSYNHYDNAGLESIDLNKKINGTFLDQTSNITWGNSGHNYRFGADYFINKKHTIGVVVNGNISERTNNNTSTTPFGSIQTNTVEQILNAENLGTFNSDNFAANINYQLNDKKLGKINFDADYGYYWKEGGTFQPNTYLEPDGTSVIDQQIYVNEIFTQIDIKTVKLDYEKVVGKGSLSAGTKVSSVTTKNGFDFFNVEGGINVLDTDRSNDFSYDETVSAAYANYAIKLNKKLSLSGGLRMEHTSSDGILTSMQPSGDNRVKRGYTDFFPSGGITYQVNKSNQLGINYSRRIDRPSYEDLNPFEYKLDELTFRKGNPFLTPQYTNSYQLTHTYKYKLTTQLSYSDTRDFFAQLTDTTGTRGSLITQQNIANSKNVSLNISYPVEITKWWSMFGNFSLYHVQYNAEIDRAEIDLGATAYNFFLQHNFLLPNNFKAELSGWYNSPSIWGGTFEINSIWSMDFGVKKSFGDNRGTFTVGVSDIFKTQKWNGVSDYRGLQIVGNGINDTRRLKIGLTYRIGNQQVKGSRKRKTGLEDEKNRIKGN